MSTFTVFGHRGAMGYCPENTLFSFEQAIKLGVDAIELDVQRCQTGELVVCHDRDISRTTDGQGFVDELSLTALQAFDAGQWETIPTLREALSLINRRVGVNIELKGPDVGFHVALLLHELIEKEEWLASDFLVSSFDHPQLEIFSKCAPQVPLGLLVEGVPSTLAACASALSADALHVNADFVNARLVDDAHQKGLLVYVWTINSPKELHRVLALSVDGVFTNYPDVIRQALSAQISAVA
jgi:glycerophosphoryl diester phosphodiesterase